MVGMTRVASSVLRWYKKRPQTERKPWELVGGLPTKMTKNLE
jgi:hypothetical protein